MNVINTADMLGVEDKTFVTAHEAVIQQSLQRIQCLPYDKFPVVGLYANLIGSLDVLNAQYFPIWHANTLKTSIVN